MRRIETKLNIDQQTKVEVQNAAYDVADVAVRGGFAEYRRQRAEALGTVDPSLPRWKQELEIIKGLHIESILKEAARSAVLLGVEKVAGAILGRLRRRSNLPTS